MKQNSSEERAQRAVDYSIYNMKPYETAGAYLIGFMLAAVVAHVFFGFIVLDVIAGAVTGFIAIPIGRNMLKNMRLNKLLIQFKDMLDSLNTSYSVGKTTPAAFKDAYNDLSLMHGEKSDICIEISRINTGVLNGANIEQLLSDFALRSSLEDIKTFADVFEAVNRRGGNIRNIIGDTRGMICDKIEIEQEIKTITSSSSNSLYVIMVMPVVIIPMMSGIMEGGGGVIDIISKIAAIILFVVAFVIGKKITKIKF